MTGCKVYNCVSNAGYGTGDNWEALYCKTHYLEYLWDKAVDHDHLSPNREVIKYVEFSPGNPYIIEYERISKS